MDQQAFPRARRPRLVEIIAAAIVASVVMAGEAAAGGAVGVEAARRVEREAGYRAAIRELMGWHGTRHNGCAAFVTTALRGVGFDVPDQRLDGPWSNPARLTFSLDAYLERAGWSRVDDPAALISGDVVFTAGAPDHVMLFHRWADAGALVALVSDNQRRRYRRALRPPTGSAVVEFGFARRAPDENATSARPAEGHHARGQ